MGDLAKSCGVDGGDGSLVIVGPKENGRRELAAPGQTKEPRKGTVADGPYPLIPLSFPLADPPSSCVSTPMGIRSCSTSLGTTWVSSLAITRTS